MRAGATKKAKDQIYICKYPERSANAVVFSYVGRIDPVLMAPNHGCCGLALSIGTPYRIIKNRTSDKHFISLEKTCGQGWSTTSWPERAAPVGSLGQ